MGRLRLFTVNSHMPKFVIQWHARWYDLFQDNVCLQGGGGGGVDGFEMCSFRFGKPVGSVQIFIS